MTDHYQNPYGVPMQGGMSQPQDQGMAYYGQAGYGGYGVAQGAMNGGYANPGQPGAYAQSNSSSLLGFTNDRFLKGLLIGAAATYLLTNENVQRSTIRGAVKAWSLVQGGVEEMKERFRDAEAEIRAEGSSQE